MTLEEMNASWDNRNRLTEVKHWASFTAYNNGAGTPDEDVHYAYDPFDRLVGEETKSNGVLDHRTGFVYDGNQIALQFDAVFPRPPGQGQGDSLVASDLSHRYLWGPAVDQLLADEQLQGANPQTVWTLGDNSVRSATWRRTRAARRASSTIAFLRLRRVVEPDESRDERGGHGGLPLRLHGPPVG